MPDDMAFADDIVTHSSSYSETQSLLEAVNRHAAKFGMRINASKTKLMAAHILREQHQAVLFDGGPLELANLFKFDVRRKRPGHQRDQKQCSPCSFRILSAAILTLVAA